MMYPSGQSGNSVLWIITYLVWLGRIPRYELIVCASKLNYIACFFLVATFVKFMIALAIFIRNMMQFGKYCDGAVSE